MKCKFCGKEVSLSVLPFHEKRCNVEKEVVEPETTKPEVIKTEDPVIEDSEQTEDITKDELSLELEDLPLDKLHDLCINNEEIKHAPSTIKRWKEARCIKELTESPS